MKQTIFQERNKVADLVFQTASGKIKIPCIEKSEAIKIYNYTLFKVETSKIHGCKKLHKSSTFKNLTFIDFRDYCWKLFRDDDSCMK